MLKPSRVPRGIIFDIWEAHGGEATVEPNSQRTRVRPPAAAGLFYAGDPRRLQANVAELIEAVEASGGVPPKALIAPHAGYVYSGAGAGPAVCPPRAGGPASQRVGVVRAA